MNSLVFLISFFTRTAAFCDSFARRLISLATTANPFPALPACAASILAFSEMSSIPLAISLISSENVKIPFTFL